MSACDNVGDPIPAGAELKQQIELHTARLIEICSHWRTVGDGTAAQIGSVERNRWQLAGNAYECAAMWAYKALEVQGP